MLNNNKEKSNNQESTKNIAIKFLTLKKYKDKVKQVKNDKKNAFSFLCNISLKTKSHIKNTATVI